MKRMNPAQQHNRKNRMYIHSILWDSILGWPLLLFFHHETPLQDHSFPVLFFFLEEILVNFSLTAIVLECSQSKLRASCVAMIIWYCVCQVSHTLPIYCIMWSFISHFSFMYWYSPNSVRMHKLRVGESLWIVLQLKITRNMMNH